MIEVIPTRLDGPVLLQPVVHGDERGFFVETYLRDTHRAAGIGVQFVQDNHSRSSRNTLRGLHFQRRPGQPKLIRVARGSIWDVVVDIRPGSATFGEWEAFELSDRNHHQVYCPIGFAHGFCVLGDSADVIYKVSAEYDESIERGIAYDDPDVGVEWPTGVELKPSERDANAPRLSEIADELPFVYESSG